MFGDNNHPSEISFWKNRLEDRTLLAALEMYPDYARKMFGPVPVMRKNVMQLGMILAARQILDEPQDHSRRALNVEDYPDLRALVNTLPLEDRTVAFEMLSAEKQQELVRDIAKRIITEATGQAPMSKIQEPE